MRKVECFLLYPNGLYKPIITYVSSLLFLFEKRNRKTFRSQNAFAFCRGCYRSRELGGRLLRAPARGGCALWREDAGFPYSFLRTWKSPASLFTGRPDYGNDFSAAWTYASAAARSASVMTLEGRLRLVGSSLTYSLPARTSSTALACLAASQSLPTSFQL